MYRLSLLLILLLNACSNIWIMQPENKRQSSSLGFLPNTDRLLYSRTVSLMPRMKIGWHPQIEKSLRHFLRKDPKYLYIAHQRRQEYEGKLEKIFINHAIPVELMNVAAIESKFNNAAVSSYGAVGMWQFMKNTAKGFGLKVNLWTDQRRDPYLATTAAARYLKHLYKKFGSWPLVLAAYNAGPTRVQSLLNKHSLSTFWELNERKLLPKQTSTFVSRVLAAIVIEQQNLQIKRYDEQQTRVLIAKLRTPYVSQS